MIVVATDNDTSGLAEKIGVPIYGDWEQIFAFCSNRPYTDGLVYLRGLGRPEKRFDTNTAFDGHEAFQREVLLVNMLSLMSDMWEIPLIVVVWGGTRLMPSTHAGVWWATIEDAVRARRSRVLRVNGLFGPDVKNAVWDALEADNPTFDNMYPISPLYQQYLINEMLSWFDYVRGVPGRDQFPSYEPSLLGAGQFTWYGFASTLLAKVRPSWQKGKRIIGNTWDSTWDTHSVHDVVTPFEMSHDDRNAMLKDFAYMAQDRGHTIQKRAKEVLFV